MSGASQNSSTAAKSQPLKAPPLPKEQPKDPQLETLNRRMKGLTDYLKARNSSIRSMDYFYNLADSIFDQRANELKEFKSSGGKVIGIMCNFVPEEMIIAAGAVSIRLAFGFSDTILTAEEYMPRNFCPLLKSSF